MLYWHSLIGRIIAACSALKYYVYQILHWHQWKQLLADLLLLIHIPYLIFKVNRPCCPKRISCTNVKTATQKTGVMSTPNAGGTNPLTARRSGSVTTVKTSHGISVILTSGYQLSTTRASMATDMRFKNGSSTDTAGWTQGSVANNRSGGDKKKEEEISDAVRGSIMCSVAGFW
jgi:hypothetical protein